MSAVASVTPITSNTRTNAVSWRRLAWVAPLTVIAAVAACYVIRAIAQALDPSLKRMGQLGPAMPTLAIEGAVAAVGVFVLFVLFVPRAIYWFRVVGSAALLLSWAPDIALGIGGTPMRFAMRYVVPLTSIGQSFEGARPAGPPPGAQTGGPPPGFFSAVPVEQVVVLMLLHAAVAAVCIGLLTTLTRRPRSA
jgi:hypothetical protein